MIAKKRLPSLGRRSPPPSRIFGNFCLLNIDAELEEFAVDPRRTPERVGNTNVSNQLPDV
jgi:hypothetical protein